MDADWHRIPGVEPDPKGGRFPPVFPHCDVINFFVRIEDNVENVEAEDELSIPVISEKKFCVTESTPRHVSCI